MVIKIYRREGECVLQTQYLKDSDVATFKNLIAANIKQLGMAFSYYQVFYYCIQPTYFGIVPQLVKTRLIKMVFLASVLRLVLLIVTTSFPITSMSDRQ